MKQERFEKVIEGDKDKLRYAWTFGILSLFLPIAFLIEPKITSSQLIFGAFLDGVVFLSFVNSALAYVESRKVYWRKIK